MASRNSARVTRRFAVSPPAHLDPQQRYSLPEAFAALRVTQATGYRMIAAGELRPFKVGLRTYVHGTELIRACRAAA